MTKDLIITEVEYSHTPKRIIRVKIRSAHPLTTRYVEAVISRRQVVWLLDAKSVIRTPSTQHNQPGPEVIHYPVKGAWFIKTEPNDNEEDNLSNLDHKIILTNITQNLLDCDLNQLYNFLYHWKLPTLGTR